jgi:hypothetical protein
MNRKRHRAKWSWNTLSNHPSLGGLKKITDNIRQDNRSLSRESHPHAHRYQVPVWTFMLQISAGLHIQEYSQIV